MNTEVAHRTTGDWDEKLVKHSKQITNHETLSPAPLPSVYLIMTDKAFYCRYLPGFKTHEPKDGKAWVLEGDDRRLNTTGFPFLGNSTQTRFRSDENIVQLHLSGLWLSGTAWSFPYTFSYCNSITSFYGLTFSPNLHIQYVKGIMY